MYRKETDMADDKDTDIVIDEEELREAEAARFTKDWLLSNALTAFVGALMLEREWNRLEDTIKVLYIVEVPDYVGTIIFSVMAVLFILSIVLATASIIPLLRGLAVRVGRRFSRLLGSLTLASFILSWTSAISTLPLDEWWSLYLIVGGLLLIVLVTLKIFR